MAKNKYVNANVEIATDNFAAWIDKTNQILTDMGISVITTSLDASGDTTVGNTFIEGIVSANTIAAADGLRGGTVDTPGTLNIVSNTHIEAVEHTSDANTTFANTVAFEAAVTASNTVHLNGSSTRVSSANTTFDGGSINIDITGDVTANATDVNLTATNVTVTTTGQIELASAVAGNSSIMIDTFALAANSTFDVFQAVANSTVITSTFNGDDHTINTTTSTVNGTDHIVNANTAITGNTDVSGVLTANNNVTLGDSGTLSALQGNTVVDDLKTKVASAVVNSLGNISTATVIDLSVSSVITATLTNSLSIDFSNVPNNSTFQEITLALTAGGTFTITWLPTIVWLNGVDPVLSTGVDFITLVTYNGGTTWYQKSVQADHVHTVSNVTGLQSALDNKADDSRITVSTGAPTGGIDGDVWYQV